VQLDDVVGPAGHRGAGMRPHIPELVVAGALAGCDGDTWKHAYDCHFGESHDSLRDNPNRTREDIDCLRTHH
jgi:hypothetical protein